MTCASQIRLPDRSTQEISPRPIALPIHPADLMSNTDFRGMKWVEDRWGGFCHRWTVRPDRGVILQTIRKALNLHQPCSIRFLAQGSFNKVYVIGSANHEVVTRVALPVEPRDKTLSEVAVLEWVRQNTSLPIPRVLAFCANRSDPSGFEWIAIEKVQGKTWDDVWKDLDRPIRDDIVRQIAYFYARTFRLQLSGIGNIYPYDIGTQGPVYVPNMFDEDITLPGMNQVQRMVLGDFWTKTAQKVSRGPFKTSREWMTARIDAGEVDCRARLDAARRSYAIEEDRKTTAVNAGSIAEVISKGHDCIRSCRGRYYPEAAER